MTPDGSPASLTTNRTASFEGAFRGVVDGMIRGWGWNPAKPYDAIDIDLYVGDLLIAKGPANAFDMELAIGQKGNGCHLYKLRVERLPPGEGPFEISAFVGGTGITLGDPLIVPSRAALESPVAERRLLGHIDGIHDGAVLGWVADLDSPDHQPAFDILFDEAPLTGARSVRADPHLPSEAGLIKAWRFSQALPAEALDGKLHTITAFVGVTPLSGAPVVFGPSEASGIMQLNTSYARDIADLRDRVAVLPSVTTTDALVDELGARIIDRVDMLLAIYRDGVEQELELMRSLLLSAATGSGTGSLPLAVIKHTTAMAAPAQTRSRYDQEISATAFEHVVTGGDLDIQDGTRGPTAQIRGLVDFELPKPIKPGQIVVLEGRGLASAEEALSWQVQVGGHAILGRTFRTPSGAWRFVGQSVDTRATASPLLNLRHDDAYGGRTPANQILEVSRIVVTDANVSHVEINGEAACGFATHIASRAVGLGWHAGEFGVDAYFRWAGTVSSIRADVQATQPSRLTIIGEKWIPGALQHLFVRVNHAALPIEIEEFDEGFKRWIAIAEVPRDLLDGQAAHIEIGVPAAIAQSPAQFEGSGDRRVLSVGVRAIAIDVAPPPSA